MNPNLKILVQILVNICIYMEEVSRKHGAFLAHGVRDLITTDDIDLMPNTVLPI